MKKSLVLALVVLFAAPALFAAASAETSEGSVEQILTFAQCIYLQGPLFVSVLRFLEG